MSDRDGNEICCDEHILGLPTKYVIIHTHFVLFVDEAGDDLIGVPPFVVPARKITVE
jgi:hypothetical protein